MKGPSVSQNVWLVRMTTLCSCPEPTPPLVYHQIAPLLTWLRTSLLILSFPDYSILMSFTESSFPPSSFMLVCSKPQSLGLRSSHTHSLSDLIQPLALNTICMPITPTFITRAQTSSLTSIFIYPTTCSLFHLDDDSFLTHLGFFFSFLSYTPYPIHSNSNGLYPQMPSKI